MQSANSQTVVFSDDMEPGGASADGLWTTLITGDINSAWELGVPIGGPSADNSTIGTQCWGTNINGKCSNPVSDAQLITPGISLAGLTTPTLTFWMYASIDKRDGGTWK